MAFAFKCHHIYVCWYLYYMCLNWDLDYFCLMYYLSNKYA